MASSGSWLRRCRLALVLAAAAASVAGCVGMPNSGSPGTVGATPQDTTQASDFIGAVPAGPQPGWTPSEIVKGFLNASISYPGYQDIAREYLAGPSAEAWEPGWSVKVVDAVDVPFQADYAPGGRTATVDVTGTVQASFDGTGQYVGAQQGTSAAQRADQKFTLAKVKGQWRITNAPEFTFRMLTEPDFVKVYRAQDLYFFDPTGQVLVPDAVFVPSGTSPSSLASNLVNALLINPQPRWLKNQDSPTPPAITAFPARSKLLSVAVDGATATINLGGAAASATAAQRQQMVTQLVWTLIGQTGNPPNIQAVQMEINGKPYLQTAAACPGQSAGPSPAQKLADYRCKNPYPVSSSPAFFYTANGQAWTRCASQSQVLTGVVGAVQAVFDKNGAAALSQPCGGPVQPSTTATPASPQRSGTPPLTMVTVSPDGKYLAGYSPSGKSIIVWSEGQARPTTTVPMSGVTAVTWDRQDYLWVAQGNATTMILQTGSSSNHGEIDNNFPGKILSLGIAPDGVRVAAVVQTGSGAEIELAAIDSGELAPGQPANPLNRTFIGPIVPIGPNVADPVALTWYDADDLLVINGTGSQTSLWEVPVDGQPATRLPGQLPGAVSITANNTQNVLVAGLTGNRIEVAAGLEGTWQPLASGGENPVFPTPAFPPTPQS